jgi:hypothetical protein
MNSRNRLTSIRKTYLLFVKLVIAWAMFAGTLSKVSTVAKRVAVVMTSRMTAEITALFPKHSRTSFQVRLLNTNNPIIRA